MTIYEFTDEESDKRSEKVGGEIAPFCTARQRTELLQQLNHPPKQSRENDHHQELVYSFNFQRNRKPKK